MGQAKPHRFYVNEHYGCHKRPDDCRGGKMYISETSITDITNGLTLRNERFS